MKATNGKILVSLGLGHSLLAVTPLAFGKQFDDFSSHLFYKISEGLIEFPILNGSMNHENFAAFWFFYFGLLLIVLGILVNYVEEKLKIVPLKFSIAYVIVVAIGMYMIPFSGMSLLMFPHAAYMLYQSVKWEKYTDSSSSI